MLQFTLRSLSFVLLCIIIIAGCQKNGEVLGGEKLSVEQAKSWFTASSSALGRTNSANARRGSKLKSFSPLWQKANEIEDDRYFVVECPVIYAYAPGFRFKTKGVKSNNETNGITKLLVLQTKKLALRNLF